MLYTGLDKLELFPWDIYPQMAKDNKNATKDITSYNPVCKFNVQPCKMMGRHIQMISNTVAYSSTGSIISERPHVYEYVQIYVH